MKIVDRLLSELGLGLASFVVALWAALRWGGPHLHAALAQRGWADEDISFALLLLGPGVVFALYGTLLYFVDTSPRFQRFREDRKMQPLYTPDAAAYWRAARVCAFNWFVVGASWTLGVAYWWMPARGAPTWPSTPSLWTEARDFAVFIVAEELLFFSSHWLLHRKAIYRFVHEQHHEFSAPFAIAAIYAHPLEHMLGNMLPLTAGPLICGSHISTTLLWITMAIVNTMTTHSGYRLPGMPDPSFHDWHHAQYIENFGVMGWLDALFGTSRRFDKHQLELAAAAAVQARAGQKGEAAATSSSTISSSGAPASEGKKVL